MNIVDANVLLYAVNDDADQHEAARQWIQQSLSGAATVGFPWLVLVAFLRIVTRQALIPRPLASDAAMGQVELWLSSPAAVIAEPTPQHLGLLRSLLGPVGTAGNLVNDAHLAALSIEHRGAVVSFDTDFALFQGITWHRPTL